MPTSVNCSLVVETMATRITTLAILDEAAKLKERELSLAKDKQIAELNDIVADLKKQLAAKQQKVLHRDDGSETSEKGQGYDMIDEILDEVEENEQRIHESESMERDLNPRVDIPKNRKKSGNETDEEGKEEGFNEPRHTKKQSQFWVDINSKLQRNDLKNIKYLIKTKELRMDERDSNGNNLLMLCSKYGLYDMVSLCINLGSSITLKNDNKKTALDIARNNGHPHIEELLIMHSLKTELTHQVSISSKSLSKKQGITSNFIKILNEIFANQNQSPTNNNNDDNITNNGEQSDDDDHKSEDSIYSISKRQVNSNAFLTTVAQALSGLNFVPFFMLYTINTILI